MLFSRVFLVLFSLIAIVSAHDFSRFSLQGAFYPLKFYDMYRGFSSNSSIPSLYQSLDVGARINTSERVGIDLLMGGFYNSGYDKDTSNNTNEYPSSYSLSGKIGIYYNLFQHKKLSLGALAQIGGYYEKHLVINYNTGDANSYKTFTPWGLIGIEPSVEITKNFAFYTTFGIEVRMNQNSMEYQFQNRYSNNIPVYRLVELSDASTDISLGGFCLGVRFQF